MVLNRTEPEHERSPEMEYENQTPSITILWKWICNEIN